MKLTDWYPPEVKPVRVGWYHTGVCDMNPRNREEFESDYNWFWDGEFWKPYENGINADYQNRYWRGIRK